MASHCVGGTFSIFLIAKYYLTRRRRFYGDLIAPTTKICIFISMLSARYCSPILTKVGFCRQNFIDLSRAQLHGGPSIWCGADRRTDTQTDRQTDGYDEANRRFPRLHKRP